MKTGNANRQGGEIEMYDLDLWCGFFVVTAAGLAACFSGPITERLGWWPMGHLEERELYFSVLAGVVLFVAYFGFTVL